MRTARLGGLVLACTGVAFLCGCSNQELQIMNRTQQTRIADLESELQTKILLLEQRDRQLAAAAEEENIEVEQLKGQVAALKEDLESKKTMISSMQERLLSTGGQLPVELTSKLEELAGKYHMISYDADHGVLKFESDLTFQKGSDQVTSSAIGGVKSLCTILNSAEAEKFDVIIAGHTDDIPVLRPETRAKHPTNWHLSAHRAISVLNIMAANNVAPKRLSVRGFGEFRPVEENKPNKGGSAKNRRVEIYIVPQGM